MTHNFTDPLMKRFQETAWSLPVARYMVIVSMGVQSFEGKEHRYIKYPVMDVRQELGDLWKTRTAAAAS